MADTEKWQEYRSQLKAVIAKVESGSSVELVVVLQQHSGFGRVFFHLWGLLLVLFVAVFLVHSPWNFTPAILVPALIGCYMLAPLLAYFAPNLPIRWRGRHNLRRLLTNQARVYWMAHGLSNTRARTSVLLMLSPVEREATWIFDLGVERCVPLAEVITATASWSRSDEKSFLQAACQGVKALAPLFAEKLPRDEDDINELSDEVYLIAAPVVA